MGSDAQALAPHDLLSTASAHRPPPNPLDNRPPPPPPRTRKGSSFPLQRFGTRFNKSTVPARSCTVLGSMDGGLAVVHCLEERTYRRLALLQQIMNMTVPTPFCLNPREHRLYKDAKAEVRVNKRRGVVDGTILEMFSTLPPSTQDQLAATVGASAYFIRENLHEIDYLCRFF